MTYNWSSSLHIMTVAPYFLSSSHMSLSLILSTLSKTRLSCLDKLYWNYQWTKLTRASVLMLNVSNHIVASQFICGVVCVG